MAAKFRTIDPRIWTDEGFVSLDLEGKLLAFWMLTSSRINRCGILIWSKALASEETEIQISRVETVCDTVCDTLHWVRDTVSKTVFLTRWWRYNPPPNVCALMGAMADLSDLPRNNLKPYLLQAIRDIPTASRDAYRKLLDTVYGTVSLQKNEKEQKNEKDTVPESLTLPVEDFIAAWNSLGKPFPPILEMTEERLEQFEARRREPMWIENWRAALAKLPETNFLRGGGPNGWIANVDYFLKPDSVVKMIEGTYASGNAAPQPAEQPDPTAGMTALAKAEFHREKNRKATNL